MPSTWTAPDGTQWAFTGLWCPDCGMPLAPTPARILGRHPWCAYHPTERIITDATPITIAG